MEAWTIEQLTTQATAELTADEGAKQSSGRVREAPDVRTLRYYTTLGLLDRPSFFRGRTGYYGRRHLLQILAIKKLQAQRLPLAEIQRRLLGATDALLSELSGRDASTGAAAGRPAASPDGAPAPAVRAFWLDRPTAPEPAEDRRANGTIGHVASDCRVELAPGVTLHLADVEADQLTPAVQAELAGPISALLNVLRRRGLAR